MEDDRRKGEEPIPEDLENYLNESQMLAIKKVETFGWTINFIRRPLFQDVVVILVSPDGEKIGVLEEDGRVNMEVDVEIRS